MTDFKANLFDDCQDEIDKALLLGTLVSTLQWALDCKEANKGLPDAWETKARAVLAKVQAPEQARAA